MYMHVSLLSLGYERNQLYFSIAHFLNLDFMHLSIRVGLCMGKAWPSKNFASISLIAFHLKNKDYKQIILEWGKEQFLSSHSPFNSLPSYTHFQVLIQMWFFIWTHKGTTLSLWQLNVISKAPYLLLNHNLNCMTPNKIETNLRSKIEWGLQHILQHIQAKFGLSRFKLADFFWGEKPSVN